MSYPQPIAWSDIRAGMHIRMSGLFEDGVSSVVAEGVVAEISLTTLTATSGLILPKDFGSTVGFSSETYELLQAFTGDTTEPGVGTTVTAADGTTYIRQPDPTNPTNSVWAPMGATTTTTWAAITALGTPTVLIQGSAY